MRAFVELEHCPAALEVTARQQTRLLELCQHPIHRRESDIDVFGDQRPVDILGAHVPQPCRRRIAVEDLEHLQARDGRLQAGVLELAGRGCSAVRPRWAPRGEGCRGHWYHTSLPRWLPRGRLAHLQSRRCSAWLFYSSSSPVWPVVSGFPTSRPGDRRSWVLTGPTCTRGTSS